MNRLIWSAEQPPPNDPEALPPRERARGGPARVLFFHGAELGFATSGRAFEQVCGPREDIDAVHVRVPIRGLARLAAMPAPERMQPWALGTTRRTLAFGATIMGLLRTVLPLDRFDVVHLTTQQRGWPIVKLAGRVSTRFAVNIDATVPAWCREFGWPRSPLNLDARMEARVLQRADLVACWSRWASDSAVRDCGARAERVTLNKACAMVDPSAPYQRHNESPARGTPGGGPVRIVFVGNDWERKGGPRLLRWHQERWKKIAELHVCSRTAPQDHTLENVVWHGATAHATLMNEILPGADLFVLPTRVDTFVIAAQEALAAGLPVVSSRLAGLPEVVRHGRTGLLCQRDDDREYVEAIERLLTDHALRREMGVAARAFALASLSAHIWHNHLFDQLVALADGRPIRFAPEGVDVRRTDDETRNPQTAEESLSVAEHGA